MKYETPELELVGTATAIVLGGEEGVADATQDANSPNALALGLDE